MVENLAANERVIAETIRIHRKAVGDEAVADSWFLAAELAVYYETLPEPVIDDMVTERVAHIAQRLVHRS
jgi:hypothetical protein